MYIKENQKTKKIIKVSLEIRSKNFNIFDLLKKKSKLKIIKTLFF